MSAAYVIAAIAAIAFSGIAAILHFKPILPGMARAGVPESWLTFPIGTLKTAGAAGLLLGLIGVPLIGAAAAIGLILFFVCAVYTHLRAGRRIQLDRRPRGHVRPSAGDGEQDQGSAYLPADVLI